MMSPGRGAAVGAMWGAAEASLFFIVPDVWVGYVALHVPRRAPVMVAAAVGGAIVGTAGLWSATRAGVDLGRLIAALPGISPRDLARARRDLQSSVAGAFLRAPFQGDPIKVYVYEAARIGIPLPRVAALVALNRLERLVPYALLTALGGSLFQRTVARHRFFVTAGYLLAWVAFYAWYLTARATDARPVAEGSTGRRLRRARRSPLPPAGSPR